MCVLFFVSLSSYAATTIQTEVVDVHDGDTFKIIIPQHPEELQYVSIRIYGINTPEMPLVSYEKTGKLKKGSCENEGRLAVEAKKYLSHLFKANNNRVTVIVQDFDKFGGRILGRVFVGNINVAEEMVSRGYAIPYFGEAKTNPWCNVEK